eukprot:5497624-Prymnesium_polylepis.2
MSSAPAPLLACRASNRMPRIEYKPEAAPTTTAWRNFRRRWWYRPRTLQASTPCPRRCSLGAAAR